MPEEKEVSGLEKIVATCKSKGTDFNSLESVEILDREARIDPANLSLPSRIQSRVQLYDFLSKELRLPEGRFFYRLWALVGESLPLQPTIQ